MSEIFISASDDGTTIRCDGCQSDLGPDGYGVQHRHRIVDCLRELAARIATLEAKPKAGA